MFGSIVFTVKAILADYSISIRQRPWMSRTMPPSAKNVTATAVPAASRLRADYHRASISPATNDITILLIGRMLSARITANWPVEIR